jgi:sporulation protein YlmC with PRC-barrel domain
MAKNEVCLDLLLGRQVIAMNGKSIGRIEEIQAVAKGRQLLIKEIHVGEYAMFERFSAWRIVRTLLCVARLKRTGYRIPWDKLDITDQCHPKLLCPTNDLRLLDDIEHRRP